MLQATHVAEGWAEGHRLDVQCAEQRYKLVHPDGDDVGQVGAAGRQADMWTGRGQLSGTGDGARSR